MDNDEQEGYKWEKAYADGLNISTVLEEDESGSIEDSIRKIILEAKRKRRIVEKPSKVRLGIMRYVYVLVDCSTAMLGQSLYPSRIQVTAARLGSFLDKFFEQNPLSQLGLIACKDKRAERLHGFTSTPRVVKESLTRFKDAFCTGEFSLNSGLQLAMQSFQGLPGHSSKEIILVIASLATVDSGNVLTTFEQLKMRGIRCSVIGLSAETFVCKKLCSTTSGKYSVILDENHFDILLSDHIQPPVAARDQEASIVRMGFPQRSTIQTPSFCMCHQTDKSGASICDNATRAFFCPQCAARYCQTPTECRVCGLLLLTAPQLARSHQHLQPLSAFLEITSEKGRRRENWLFGEMGDAAAEWCL
ncbi:ssl1-like domain-containing protein [Ditylenchus destructor]|uniref:Ssl1-like domain-containing protein n=1 Tax=Ditylenchus destructor TaxID=166010 RepID=A0AAD4NLB6_9BILA|nr:ssl1-like domain-containing protein [Ditylenchus destructor]